MKKVARSWNSTLRSQSAKQKAANQQWAYLRQRAITEQLDIWGHNHCELCGEAMWKDCLEAHHMKRRSRGGEYTWDNLRLVGIWCGCHNRFTNNEV